MKRSQPCFTYGTQHPVSLHHGHEMAGPVAPSGRRPDAGPSRGPSARGFRALLILSVAGALGSLGSLGCDDSTLDAPDAALTDSGTEMSDAGVDASSDGSLDGGEHDNPTWARESHENGVDPDYETVFPNDVVHRIDLTISASDWAAMQADLDANLGRGGGPPGMAEVDFTPEWSEATLEFDGARWDHVGIRYKGNSSLQSAYASGGDKYPFKLDFDEWEDTYPTIDNQRFFGFKQLNLSSNYNDGTGMREKVVSDLFREFGVPAAHTAFCEVYLDRGEGPTFIGLYTLVEEVDDTVYEEQFADDEGNLYKPDGDAASFAEGTFDTAEMDLKTNEDDADYADVSALYDILHDTRRTTDQAGWIADLEATFDVEQFLRYLAVNQVIQNWDTYGKMTHNYFLYSDEGLLTWIPWDNNEALQGGSGPRSPLSLGLDEVTDAWPIIRYLIDVDAYRDRYIALAQQFVTESFNAAGMGPVYDAYEALLRDVAERENSRFASDVATLRAHVAAREAAVGAL